MTERLSILHVPSPGLRLPEPKPTAVKCRNWHLFEDCNCLSLDPDIEEEGVARNINKLFA